MANIDLHGQKNLTLAVGAPGDKTITVPVAAVNARIKNYDSIQSVLYSLVLAPVFPTDWLRLAPGETIDLTMAANPAIHFRKPFWVRAVNAGVETTPGQPDVLDIPVMIDIQPIDWS